jgi:hypothetical protein
MFELVELVIQTSCLADLVQMYLTPPTVLVAPILLHVVAGDEFVRALAPTDVDSENTITSDPIEREMTLNFVTLL